MKTFVLMVMLSFMLQAQSEYLTNATDCMGRGDFPAGMSYVEQSLTAADTTKEILLLGTQLAVKLDDLNLAKTYMELANKLDPKDQEILNTWEDLKSLSILMREGSKALNSNFYDEAIQSYDSTLTRFPEFALASYMKGMVYIDLKDFDQAVDNFRNAVKLNPFEENYSKAILNIAVNFFNMGNDDSRRGDFNLAIEDYTKALEYNPEFPEAYFRMAYALYKLKKFDEAIKSLEEAIRFDLDASDHQSRKLMGDVYQNLRDRESALSWYLKSIKVKPDYDKALYAIGKVLYNLNRRDEAVPYLTKCIQSNPDYFKAHELIGMISMENGEVDLAITHLRIVVENDARAYVAWYRLAAAYNEARDSDNAREAAKSCLNIKKDYVAAYYELGIAEKCNGNKIAALDAFKTAMDKDRKREWKDLLVFQIDNIDKSCDE